jgi:5'-methylthioadenosine phosphorylase
MAAKKSKRSPGRPRVAEAGSRPKLKAKAQTRQAEIGILGGTGLYEIEGIKNLQEVKLKTPFGDPSDAYILGTIEGRRVAFLSRHGRGHRISPSEINSRANVYGFKMLGIERVISVSSVGSLRAEIYPRDIVFADQFIDKTRRRDTFFGEGCVAHVSFAEPACRPFSKFLYDTAVGLGVRARLGAVYVCMEGPAFSTKAESKMHRAWGGDLIGMTGAPEAKLFREAEICYAPMCLATDYDAWHDLGESVSVEMVLDNLRNNIQSAKAVLRKALETLPAFPDESCACRKALAGAVMTAPTLIPAATRKRLALLLGKYQK